MQLSYWLVCQSSQVSLSQISKNRYAPLTFPYMQGCRFFLPWLLFWSLGCVSVSAGSHCSSIARVLSQSVTHRLHCTALH